MVLGRFSRILGISLLSAAERIRVCEFFVCTNIERLLHFVRNDNNLFVMARNEAISECKC
jgi:hypothetical protein